MQCIRNQNGFGTLLPCHQGVVSRYLPTAWLCCTVRVICTAVVRCCLHRRQVLPGVTHHELSVLLRLRCLLAAAVFFCVCLLVLWFLQLSCLWARFPSLLILHKCLLSASLSIVTLLLPSEKVSLRTREQFAHVEMILSS
jgi:hypothetical protein